MSRTMTKEALYEELRRRIITMELAPSADLDEAELSQAYGMSRTPVRETLIRLQSEGLVVMRRNRGASVAPLDVGTLQSWFEAGRMIHRSIVRLAALRRRDDDLASIREGMEEFEAAMAAEDALRMVYANERFHDRIGQAARNPYLYAAYTRVLADHERISELCYGFELVTQSRRDLQLTLDQHRQLFEAIAAGDPATAERVIEEHITLCRDGLRRVLEDSDGVFDDMALADA